MLKPLVVRSREEIMDQFSKNGQPPISASLPIKPDGVRYTMTQEVTWLDDHYFAVGRWDGTLNIFRFNHSSTDGPVITFSINSPSEEGIQMIVWISSTIFITSNNKNSFVLWETHSSTWNEVKGKVINYELSLGVANSGTSVQINNNLYTVIGHESGFISIWDFTNCIEPQFIAKIDLQSTHPVNPWGIHNIRSVNLIEKRSGSAIVLTGSEDGDLCMIEIPSGNIIYRTVYNPAAQRGINSIACINTNEGMSILVANCSVGEQDKNLWHFTLDASGQLTLTDSINLRLNQSDPQVFNFDVVFGRHNNELYFFSTTEEGALWMGKTQGGKITVIGHKMFGQQLGAAIATTNTGKLITAAYDIYEFVTNELQEEIQGENPEWLITVKN